MDISIKNSRVGSYDIFWAVTASILLHVLVAVVVPNFDFSAPKELKQVIKVELVKPEPPAPEPIVEPLPPIEIPEPPKPQPIKKKPKPIQKPKPIREKAPEPIAEPEPEVVPPPIVEEVIAVAPTVEAPPPEVVIPQPPPPVETPPEEPKVTQADINNALSAYGNLLGRAIAKHKSYPRIAERRQWQGTVLLDLLLDGSGNVKSASVSKSSGYEALDKRALKMVKQASPFPAPPPALQDRSFNLTVPVVFKLAT